jgi:hypothetical protein
MFDITAAIAYAVRMLYPRKSTVSAGEEASLLALGLHTTLPSATSTLDTCSQIDAIRRYNSLVTRQILSPRNRMTHATEAL